MSFKKTYRLTFILLCSMLLMVGSSQPPANSLEQARAFTRAFEFDFFYWTLGAFGAKLEQFALGASNYLPAEAAKEVVLGYLDLINQTNQLEAKLNDIYADPNITDPEAAAGSLPEQLEALRSRRKLLEPLTESILQRQVSQVVTDLGLAFLGQPVPPVLYRTTPPPDSLIISPRREIRQDHNIPISPALTAEQQDELETKVDRALDVSSLVVGIGGIGLYPTMVMETPDLNYLIETVAHEWVHNYLTLRPLGISYVNSPELRTMNETAASIAGVEIGREVIARYYPEHLPPPPQPSPPEPQTEPEAEPAQPPPFDFRAEMHLTRINTDKLLAAGKIKQAELYMELRRRFFWDNGYHLRKLNQAYFAFYGAYADQPGGAAGEDPVGSAVRTLRAQSSSLAEFINRISWMWKFDQLQRTIE